MKLNQFIFVLLCGLIQGQTQSGRFELPKGRQTGPLNFAIGADKVFYQPGETIRVLSSLSNSSDETISLFMGPRVSFYRKIVIPPGADPLVYRKHLEMSEEGKRRVFPGHTSAASQILKPGGEILDKFEMDQLYPMSVPGDYHIVFYFQRHSLTGKGVEVMSNEIVVNVERKVE